MPHKRVAQLVEHYWRIRHFPAFQIVLQTHRETAQREAKQLGPQPDVETSPRPFVDVHLTRMNSYGGRAKRVASRPGSNYCQRCARSFATPRALCGHRRMHS